MVHISMSSFTFQTDSMGARIDLRTMMGALLNPTIIRSIMKNSQESRTLYYHLRICQRFLICYRNVHVILGEVLTRRIENGKHEFDRVDPNDYSAVRKLAAKKRKPCFARIIEETLKGSLERLQKILIKTPSIEIPIEEESLPPSFAEGEDAGLDLELDRPMSRQSTRASSFSTRSIIY